jgi:hypothetical protein
MAHEHVTWRTASMITTRCCGVCGALVAGDMLDAHQKWHDRFAVEGEAHDHDHEEVDEKGQYLLPME